MAELREARMGLATGKKVNKVKVRIARDEADWQVMLDAANFTFQGLKTPKVDIKLEEGEDPDSRILEKVYLMEKCMDFVDIIFVKFLNCASARSGTRRLRGCAGGWKAEPAPARERYGEAWTRVRRAGNGLSGRACPSFPIGNPRLPDSPRGGSTDGSHARVRLRVIA